MKTLDEVINNFEICRKARLNIRSCDGCTYADDNDVVCISKNECDVLHYLKEYRERQEMLRYWSEKAISEQQNLSDTITFMQAYREDKDDLTALRAYWAEQQANPPLTWEQLKQMDMQPVWYESLYWGMKAWGKVLVQPEDIYIDIVSRRKNGQIYSNRFSIYEDQQGEMWQIYRKERK